MAIIPDHIIDEVRNRADIVEVVSGYLPLKQSGANFRCLCPFHDEKTPSFNVNPGKQIFHCFGCGEGGNVFSFIIKYENVAFPEAVRLLADRYGVKIPVTESKKSDPELDRLYSAMRSAADFYHDVLKKGKPDSSITRYLGKRGLTKNLVDEFELGFAPDSWDELTKHLTSTGFNEATLEKAGLASRSSRGTLIDRFRARLIFPIKNVGGKVIGFGGRLIAGDDKRQAKYINSPETPIYIKNRTLYGIDLAAQSARKERMMIVTEGYMDVIALRAAGVKNVVACSGTAFTGGQARLIRRLCESVTLFFDSDKAGYEAAKRSGLVILDHGLKVRVGALPGSKDPDEFLSTHGPDEFAAIVKKAPAFPQFIIDTTLAKADLANVDSRTKAVHEVIPYLKNIKDEIEKSNYIQILAEKTGTDLKALTRAIEKDERKFNLFKKDMTPQKEKKTGMGEAERILIRILLNHPEYLESLASELAAEDFSDPVYSSIFSLILQNAQAGADSAAQVVDITEDETLKKVITAITFEQGLIDEPFASTTVKDCIRLIKYSPEEKEKRKKQWVTVVKEAMKTAVKERNADIYPDIQEKYLESRKKRLS